MSGSIWSPERDCRPGENELQVWTSRRPGPGVAPVASGWNDAELARYAGLRSEDDRARGLAGRGLLRRALARSCGCSPAEIELTIRSGGKPELRRPESRDISFSVSTSQDIVVVAIASGLEVGIDVERICELPERDRLATLVLDDGEHHAFQAVPAADQTRWLLQRWAVKEAVLKARGVGLSADPREVVIVQHGTETVAPSEHGEWYVRELTVDPRYVAAVAGDRPVVSIVQFEDAW